MPARVLRDLDLDEGQVASAADFLELYAEGAVEELDALTATAPALHADDPGAGGPALADDPAFAVAADAASAFREAAQWAMYLDPAHAGRLLARAGELFYQMGLPYGMYLMVVAGDWT